MSKSRKCTSEERKKIESFRKKICAAGSENNYQLVLQLVSSHSPELVNDLVNGYSYKVRCSQHDNTHSQGSDDESIILLFVSAIAGHDAGAALLDTLIKNGVDINRRITKNYNTPLLLALLERNENAVNKLLNAGADIRKKNKEGVTPFLRALNRGLKNSVDRLIELGVNISDTDNNGNNALFYAADSQNERIIHLLLDEGFKIDRANRTGQTALSIAALSGKKESVKLLYKRGANINYIDALKNTVLLNAVRSKKSETIAYVLKHCKRDNINVANKNDETPLLLAVMNNNVDLVRKLLEMGANADAVNKNTDTPLMLAAEKGLTCIVELLLAHKANAGIRNKLSKTALDLAREGGHTDCMQLLTENNSLHKQLLKAIKKDDLVASLSLISKVDLFQRDRYGVSPIHLAASENVNKAHFINMLDVIQKERLPAKYSDFHNPKLKEEIREYIGKMNNPAERAALTSRCHDYSQPLGYVMHLKRGVLPCRSTKGVLKELKSSGTTITQNSVTPRQPDEPAVIPSTPPASLELPPPSYQEATSQYLYSSQPGQLYNIHGLWGTDSHQHGARTNGDEANSDGFTMMK